MLQPDVQSPVSPSIPASASQQQQQQEDKEPLTPTPAAATTPPPRAGCLLMCRGSIDLRCGGTKRSKSAAAAIVRATVAIAWAVIS